MFKLNTKCSLTVEIQDQNTNLVDSLECASALQCNVSFLPKQNLTKYIKSKGYDYVSRSKECFVVFNFLNLTDKISPQRLIEKIQITSSKGVVFEETHGQRFIPEIPPWGKRDIALPIHRRYLESEVHISFDLQKFYLPSGARSSSDIEPLPIILLSSKILLIDKGKDSNFKRNQWEDYFYILSLDKEIDEINKKSSDSRSFAALIISFASAIFSILHYLRIDFWSN